VQKNITNLLRSKWFTLGILLVLLTSSQALAANNSGTQEIISREAVFIGVLAHRGIEGAYKQWTLTANYLTPEFV